MDNQIPIKCDKRLLDADGSGNLLPVKPGQPNPSQIPSTRIIPMLGELQSIGRLEAPMTKAEFLEVQPETLQQSLETALMERDVALRQVEELAATLNMITAPIDPEEFTAAQIRQMYRDGRKEARKTLNKISNLESYRQHQAAREAVIQAARRNAGGAKFSALHPPTYILPHMPDCLCCSCELWKSVDKLEKLEGGK